MTVREKRIRLNKFLAAVALCELLILGAHELSLEPTVARTLASVPSFKPADYTELYFEENTTVPNIVQSGGSIDFAYTIHNLEHKTMDYTYEVSLDTVEPKQIIDQGTVRLKHDEYKTISEHFTFKEAASSARVVVKLTNKNQDINFWIGEDTAK